MKELIKRILNSLIKEFEEGACDDLTEELELLIIDSLVKLNDTLLDKQDKVMTIEEASLYLNVTRLTLNSYIKQNKLHPIKHRGGVLEFKFKELKNFKNLNMI